MIISRASTLYSDALMSRSAIGVDPPISTNLRDRKGCSAIDHRFAASSPSLRPQHRGFGGLRRPDIGKYGAYADDIPLSDVG